MSGMAVDYYGPRFSIGEGVQLGTDDLVGQDDLTALDAYRAEPSLWVLFTMQVSPARDLLLCYLNEIGQETERVAFEGAFANNPGSLHRYDLSDEARWGSADPATFPVTGEAFAGDAPRCRRQTWSMTSF
jgi:hypothetical protein